MPSPSILPRPKCKPSQTVVLSEVSPLIVREEYNSELTRPPKDINPTSPLALIDSGDVDVGAEPQFSAVPNILRLLHVPIPGGCDCDIDEIPGLSETIYVLDERIGNIESYVAGGSNTLEIKEFVVTPQMLAAKAAPLDFLARDPLEVELSIYGGIEQKSGVDFLIDGLVLSWNALAVELLLEVGTVFSVRYIRL